MRITIESTSRLVTLIVDNAKVPARLWEGHTENGIPCHCFVTRISPTILESDPRVAELSAEFDRDLTRTRKPETDLGPIDLRFIL